MTVRNQGTISICAQQERTNHYTLASSATASCTDSNHLPSSIFSLGGTEEEYSAFLTIFVIKITNEKKMGAQQYKSDETFIVTNTLYIYNHLVEPHISSRELISNTAWPTGIVFIHCSTIRRDTVIPESPPETTILSFHSYVFCGYLKVTISKIYSGSTRYEK